MERLECEWFGSPSLVCELLVVMGYSEVLLFLFEFSIKTVGGGSTASRLLCIRFAHPTGRPSGAQQTTLSTAKKVTLFAVSFNGEA